MSGDVLAHEYQGRYSPEILTKALAFRDGVCITPGCLTPADRCDIDHREPWPEGKTVGRNLDPRCKPHHNAKGHGILTWYVNGRPLEPPPPPVIEYAA